MSFVLDASVAACWVFRDEEHPIADLARDRLQIEEAIVPALWWFEVRNLLIVNERRGRLTENESVRFLGLLGRVGIQRDDRPDDSQMLRLARAHRLSVYDAAYLELALRHRIALATLDGALIHAARAESVPLVR